MKKQLIEKLSNKLTRIRYSILKRKIKNRNCSIISSNCIGGVMSKVLGLRFNSPFVNLWVKPRDFIKIVKNLEEYMKYDLTFIEKDGIEYPVALLNDVEIYFYHYKDNEDALRTWNERKKRINYDNLIVVFTDRDGCTYNDILEFDTINYSKIIYTHRKYKNIKSSFYIHEFKNEEAVGNLIEKSGKLIKKHKFERFNYIKLINKCVKKQKKLLK